MGEYCKREEAQLLAQVYVALHAWLVYRRDTGVLGMSQRRAARYVRRRLEMMITRVKLRGGPVPQDGGVDDSECQERLD